MRLKEDKKALDTRIGEIENTIKADMGEAESGLCGSFHISWKSQNRQTFQASDPILYNNKTHCSECQFQLGYKGLIDLAYRSGEVSIIQAQVVYEHDSFNYSFGLEPVLKHIPAVSDRGEPTYVYAMFRTKEGGFGFDVMSMDAVRTFAQQYSKSFSSGPWQTNFEEMAKKTVLKKVLKYAPLKSDFQRGSALDGTIKTDVGEDMYAVPGTVLEVDSETGEVTEVGPEA